MKVGIVGYAGVGKTALFAALTGQPVSQVPGERHLATVEVADPRLQRMRDVFQPRKYTLARFEIADLPAVPQGDVKGRGEVLAELREPEALVLVVGTFEHARMLLPADLADAAKQRASLEDDLLLLDLELAEKRLERIDARLKKGGGDRDALQKERDYVQRIYAALEEGADLPEVEDRRQETIRAEMRLFRLKPRVVVFNVDEESLVEQSKLLEGEATHGAVLTATVEQEIAQLEGEDRDMFLSEYGLTEPAASRLTRLAYDALDLIAFFTVGPDEVRSWPIVRGSDAVTAAGKIHSDLARGFIRAEVTPYESVKDSTDERSFKAAATAELKGKDYVVQDGDILNIRFNV